MPCFPARDRTLMRTPHPAEALNRSAGVAVVCRCCAASRAAAHRRTEIAKQGEVGVGEIYPAVEPFLALSVRSRRTASGQQCRVNAAELDDSSSADCGSRKWQSRESKKRLQQARPRACAKASHIAIPLAAVLQLDVVANCVAGAMSVIIVDTDAFCQRIGLACEHVAVGDLVVLQRMVGNHLHLALRHARSAG